MFSGTWKESKQSNITLNIPNKLITAKSKIILQARKTTISKVFCLSGLDQVFGSLYRDEIDIEPNEVVSLLAAATLLQLVRKLQ